MFVLHYKIILFLLQDDIKKSPIEVYHVFYEKFRAKHYIIKVSQSSM